MSRLVKHTITFSTLTLVSRVTGLLRVSAFAAILGSGRFDDAYQLANTVPNIIYEFVMGGLLSAILIPLLVEAQKKHGKTSSEAWRAANLLLGYVGSLLAVVSALAILFSPEIIALLTHYGKSVHAESSRQLAVYFFRFFAPQIFFYGLSAVFMAILNSHGVFAITAAAPIFNNLTVIATLILYRFQLIGTTGLAVGTTAGIATMALIQMPWLLKLGMPLRPRVDFSDPLLKSVVTLGLPVLAVAIANVIGTIIRTNLLFTVGSGFTTYTFCFQLIMVPYGIFAVSIATVLYPTLTQHAVSRDHSGFLDSFVLGTRWTTVVLLPISLGLALLAEPLTRILFERGEFTYANTRFTARFLQIYSLSILPYALVVLASRGFYAYQNTRTPMWINIVGVAVSILVMFSLYPAIGVLSVAAAAVVTYCLTTFVSYLILFRDAGTSRHLNDLRSLWRVVAAAGCMSITVHTATLLGTSHIEVLQRGSRFPAHVDARYDAGGYMLIQNAHDFRQFWSLISRDDTPAPPLDFRNSRVVVAFAPRGSTTSTLSIKQCIISRSESAADILVSIQKHHGTRPDALEEPAYLVAVVRSPVKKCKVQYVVENAPIPSKLTRLFHISDFLKLLATTSLGALVFILTGLALKVREIQQAVANVTTRFRQLLDSLKHPAQ